MLRRIIYGSVAALVVPLVFGASASEARADDFRLFIGTPGFGLGIGHGHHGHHHYRHHHHHDYFHHGHHLPHYPYGRFYYYRYRYRAYGYYGYPPRYVLPPYGGIGFGVYGGCLIP